MSVQGSHDYAEHLLRREDYMNLLISNGHEENFEKYYARVVQATNSQDTKRRKIGNGKFRESLQDFLRKMKAPRRRNRDEKSGAETNQKKKQARQSTALPSRNSSFAVTESLQSKRRRIALLP